MKNKKIAILLVIILVLMQIMPTYAATATGSNADAATPSNADEIILESDEFSEKLETLKSYSSVPVLHIVTFDRHLFPFALKRFIPTFPLTIFMIKGAKKPLLFYCSLIFGEMLFNCRVPILLLWTGISPVRSFWKYQRYSVYQS